jgi:hypothetical protein
VVWSSCLRLQVCGPAFDHLWQNAGVFIHPEHPAILNSKYQGGLVVLAASASSELALCEGRKFESSSTTKLVTLRKSLQSLEDTKDYLGGSIKCLWIWLKGARRQLVWTRRNDLCVWERDAWQVVLQSVAATPSAVCFRPMSR